MSEFIINDYKYGVAYTECDDYITTPEFKVQHHSLFKTIEGPGGVDEFVSKLKADRNVGNIYTFTINEFVRE